MKNVASIIVFYIYLRFFYNIDLQNIFWLYTSISTKKKTQNLIKYFIKNKRETFFTFNNFIKVEILIEIFNIILQIDSYSKNSKRFIKKKRIKS